MANLFDPPGTPLGTSFYAERDWILAHLRRRLWRYLDTRPGFTRMNLEHRIDQIQRRLHRYDPTLRQRQDAARAATPPPAGNAIWWSWAELEHIAAHFEFANDETGQAIGAKARLALERRA